MNTEKELQKVEKEIKNLSKELRAEAKLVDEGDILLTVEENKFEHTPKVDAPFLSDEWQNQDEAQHKYFEAVDAGERKVPLTVRVKFVSDFNRGTIHVGQELLSEIELFKYAMEDKYQRKFADLRKKRYALQQVRKAERYL